MYIKNAEVFLNKIWSKNEEIPQKKKKKARERYQNLSKEEKKKQQQYGRERHKNLPEDEKQQLVV